jgi:DNA-binding XRE family transcriptional regulator
MSTKTKRTKPQDRLAASRVVDVVGVAGLQGKGLLRLGKESRLELRDRLQMPRVMFGRVVNVSERTIAKVEGEGEQVEKLRRPYNEVYRLCDALGEVVDPASLGDWFKTPNVALEGLKPIEVIERGEIDRLWTMAFRLRSGLPG